MTQTHPPIFNNNFRTTLIDLFKWRRDVRSFLPMPVSQSVLSDLLQLADLAPSVGLSQPWRFIMVDNPARRAAIKANFEACNALAMAGQNQTHAGIYAKLKLAGLDQAPCQFAVCTDLEPEQGRRLGRATMPEMTSYSTVMAIHTLWLAARAYGLGLGWISILDPAAVMDVLELPGSWQLTGYFCLGYPALTSDTPELERMGWEQRRSSPSIIYR